VEAKSRVGTLDLNNAGIMSYITIKALLFFFGVPVNQKATS